MASKFGSDDEAIADINVVPLVDIILVVLIIFMVTAPMFIKPSINVNLPRAASGDETLPSQLNVTLTADGRVVLNGKAADQEAVRQQALNEVAKNPEVQAVIAADKDVPHGQVVGIIDVVKSAGVKKFAISIDKAQK
ncbi:MAG: ExbD/TolR family protein [Pseudobdellovibrionaceae bacterium]